MLLPSSNLQASSRLIVPKIFPDVSAETSFDSEWGREALAICQSLLTHPKKTTSNTACFQAFLNVLSRKFARQDLLLVLDGAPNHRCGYLALPDNISLLFLPPYSPELNPKENLWNEIREKIFKNYALKSIDAVRAKLKQAILYIERNPKIVQSITSFPYIATSL